jgi:large subunit ribosomal protein L6
MSRIGKLPVQIPDKVKIQISETRLTVEGPKGTLVQDYLPEVEIKQEDNVCIVVRKNETKRARAMHGLYRQLLANMVQGVTTGFTRELQINGVGYRAELKDNVLVLSLGYSNPIEYVVPEGVDVACDGPNKVTVHGIDKCLVGKVASEIRSLRPPEPYKGKGVKYTTETIRRKVGKAGIK